MAGLTLGGGYWPLIGRFGLALDNLVDAEVVLADGRVVLANDADEAELLWALRGGGATFGVVTAMHCRLHALTSVRTGLLIYPFTEAMAILNSCAEIAASANTRRPASLGCARIGDGRWAASAHDLRRPNAPTPARTSRPSSLSMIG